MANKPLKLKEFEGWDNNGAFAVPHTNYECNNQTKIVEVHLSFQTHDSLGNMN